MLFKSKSISELNGAWEEPGVIGRRIEIDSDKIVILWRGSPVLETKFRSVKREDYSTLYLQQNGLRYKNANYEYAQIKEIKFINDTLEIKEQFPISGESKATLKKTSNTRYGDYDIDDSILEEIKGIWKSQDGYFEIKINNDELSLNGKKTNIHILRSRSEYEPSNRYIIADVDPSVDGFQGFTRFIYENGILSTTMIVLDAGTIEYIFQKVK